MIRALRALIYGSPGRLVIYGRRYAPRLRENKAVIYADLGPVGPARAQVPFGPARHRSPECRPAFFPFPLDCRRRCSTSGSPPLLPRLATFRHATASRFSHGDPQHWLRLWYRGPAPPSRRPDKHLDGPDCWLLQANECPRTTRRRGSLLHCLARAFIALLVLLIRCCKRRRAKHE
jgi:hypothetical protein